MEIKTENTNSSTVNQQNETINKINVPACILLLFAEYLGYVSDLIEWCEEWCTTDNFPEFKKKILYVDASSVLKKMQKDYTIDELHQYYNQFYEVAIKGWVEKLKTHDSQTSSI